MASNQKFNPPPGWEVEAYPWEPPAGWKRDDNWPDPPVGWQFWVEVTEEDLARNQTPDLLANESFSEREIETKIRARLVNLDDELVIQESGYYEYHHPLETAEEYKQKLSENISASKEMIRSGLAVTGSKNFTYDNSQAKGSKLVTDLCALALNAFNQEVENCVRTLKAGALQTALKRTQLSAEKIERFGKLMDIHISSEYMLLRIQELELTADYLAKVEEQKQKLREERERLREEEKAKRELEAEKEKLQKERQHYINAIEALMGQGNIAEIAIIQSKLSEIDEAIKLNDYRISNVRAGYVYVISNEGAFGSGVVKIGMTRRLDPMDRVIELGDASVPFRFSVHAIYFSDDAISLENKLHKQFENQRVNRINPRKEFFFATPDEVREELVSAVGALLDFDSSAISEEYLQSRGGWPSARTFETGMRH